MDIESAIQLWIVADPQAMSHRIMVVMAVISTLISVPLFVFSCYLWRLGVRIVQSQELPPSGYWVLTDISVVTGPKALFRGRMIKILGFCLGSASVLFGLLFWIIAESQFAGKV